MNKGAGLAVLMAVAAAAIRMSSGGGASAPAAPAPHPTVHEKRLHKQLKPAAVGAGYVGGCAAYQPDPRDSKPGPKPPVTYPEHAEYAGAQSVIDKFLRRSDFPAGAGDPPVHYAIAIVPDPRHTNLSLMFDRQMVAIQQAAQDEEYTYNSSWLPWSTENASFNSLQDQQLSADLADQQEACPGVLLFRRSAAATGSPSGRLVFADTLIVLVVGEQPTAGVNQDQWDNAIHWLRLQNNPPSHGPLRVLGPTFSGSLVSLDRNLKALAQLDSTFAPVQVLSGSVSSCPSIQWFLQQQKTVEGQPVAQPVTFGTFQESDELQIYRFLSYIGKQGVTPHETALLSEDETAYGSYHSLSDQTICGIPYRDGDQPIRLYYPRDMSALRAQYQKESIFDSATNSGAHQSHSILQDSAEAEDENKQASDTIPTYSGTLTPIAQESVLYGVVSDLRAHHPRYLLLRCTNPLDALFLTRFFHRTYPEGRIVILGQDLLLRREVDTTEFRGVLGISNYPLLPSDQHWSLLINNADQAQHAHRVFESYVAQGTYLAARYAFDATRTATGAATLGPITFERKPGLPGYTDPYWLHLDSLAPAYPPTWLSVVGRDGFWPIAVLNQNTTPHNVLETPCPGPNWFQRLFHLNGTQPPPCTRPQVPVSMVQLPAGALQYSTDAKGRPGPRLTFSLPLSWDIFAIAVLGLLFYQIYGLYLDERVPSSGLMSVFRPSSSPSQQVLVALSCLVVVLVFLESVSPSMALPSLQVISDTRFFDCYVIVSVLAVVALALLLLHRGKPRFRNVSLAVLLVVALGYATVWYFLHRNQAANLPLFYRMGHLTSGVSPVLPILFLSLGFYLSAWQAMAGNLLLCDGRPLLPDLSSKPGLFRISANMDRQIIRMARPLSLPHEVIGLPAVVIFCVIFLYLKGWPLLSLEGWVYTWLINIALLIAFVLSMVETTRLFNTWLYLHKLLDALSTLRLRRTFAHLRAVPATSLWGVSGNVQRIQYEFFLQQLDAAAHLYEINKSAHRLPHEEAQHLENIVKCGKAFVQQNADKLTNGPHWSTQLKLEGSEAPVLIREVFDKAVSGALCQILVPYWDSEKSSLCLDTSAGAVTGNEQSLPDMALCADDTVKAAEEFVCLHYIAYIQNILARMRTMILSLACLFVSVCFAIAFYPFVPRTQVAVWMMIDLIFIAAAVIYVYSGMERDETLSFITNTKPGKLGAEFWIKTAAFLAGPVLGVLTTQFPAIADSVLGWLQPGLDAFKS